MDRHILAMRKMITGFQVTQAIHAAAKLSIADHIQRGVTSCDALAKLTKTNSDKLYRLLCALTSIGIFSETTDQNFKLTEKAQLLCSDHPHSLRHYALMYGEEAYITWAELESALSSEKSVFESHYGESFFQYLANNSEANSIFNLAMKNSTASYKGKIVSHYDFSRFKTLVDIGGGTGELLAEILAVTPHLQTALYEQPLVIEQAKKLLKDSNFSHSIKFIDGDFFKSIPPQYNAYIMRHIVHDWPLDKAKQILSNCCQAMNKDSVLLLIEGVIKSTRAKDPLKWIDLHMMVTLNGKERTKAEFATMLHSCGLKMKKIIPVSGSHLSIIEVKKA